MAEETNGMGSCLDRMTVFAPQSEKDSAVGRKKGREQCDKEITGEASSRYTRDRPPCLAIVVRSTRYRGEQGLECLGVYTYYAG